MGIFSFFSNSSNSERTLSEEEYLAYKKYLEDKKYFEEEKTIWKENQYKQNLESFEKSESVRLRENKVYLREKQIKEKEEELKANVAYAEGKLAETKGKYDKLSADFENKVRRIKANMLEIDRLKETINALEVQVKEKENISVQEVIELRGKLAHTENKLCNLEADKRHWDEILSSKEPFASVASLYADVSSCLLCDGTLEVFKNSKKHLKAEDRLREIKEKYKSDIAALKEFQYKFDYLMKVVPDLEDYFSDNDSMGTILKSANEDSQEDETRQWLSRDEYDRKNEDERAQLVLDRYMASHNKNSWQIGRDYETFVAWKFFNEKQSDGVTPKYRVIQEGCNKKKEDRGRDVIAINRATGKVYIIQCKMWAKEKIIHEKHIFQLYGSALDYVIRNNLRLADVEPVFITTIQLSDYAKKCAELLHVAIREDIKMGEYAPIKLNINEQTGEKIYHIPVDQQYDRVKLENEGEGYAFTVAEALEKGFRRAHRFSMLHVQKKNNLNI